MCGYDVTIHEKATEKEAVAEALRAKRALDNARRKINKNLSILFSASLFFLAIFRPSSPFHNLPLTDLRYDDSLPVHPLLSAP